MGSLTAAPFQPRTHFPTRQVMTEVAVEAQQPAPGLPGMLGAGDAELLRFLTGQDAQPAPMSDAEVRDLGDVFTREILLKGKNPLTLAELMRAIDEMDEPLPDRKMFLVDESAQFRAAGKAFQPNARLAFTWQASSSRPPDMLLSTVAVADNNRSLLQLIAWSEKDGAFHFFERKNGKWLWAGNSFHALKPPTRGQGPFDSHINGGLVMKELKAPWTHWHSMDATIDRQIYGADSEFNKNPLFAELEGAQLLEPIVQSGVRRWTKGRIARDLAGGSLNNLPSYMKQVLWCTSINLTSSFQGLASAGPIDLPTTFFYDADAIESLCTTLDQAADVVPHERLQVDPQLYRQAVNELHLAVIDDSDDRRRIAGDTHFAFLVPERAFEDLAVVQELVTRGVLSAKLGLCLLLVDFSNPVFSPRRAALLQHFPATIAAGQLGAALDGALIQKLTDAQPAAGTPEAELLDLWSTADILGRARQLLHGLHNAIQARLAVHDGVRDVVRLAESRRDVVRRTRSLAEFSSTLAQGGMPEALLAMLPDATLAVKDSDVGEGEL